ncbi:MAG: metallophosphoesterase [Planctomycetota bacterium]
MRVLHLADLHLDTPYSHRSKDLRDQLQDAAGAAFAAAVDAAIGEELVAVLVAGDLFDRDTLSFATERRLIEQIGRLGAAGIPFLYACGNHDPAGQTRALQWPDNVTLFEHEKPRSVEVATPAGRLRVTGAGHQSQRCGTNLAALFPTVDRTDGVPHIALLHAQLESAINHDRHDRYAPATRSDLVDKGYDYWALGHVHERQQVCEDPVAWYAGIPQGRTPKESGPRGANIVALPAAGGATVEFLPLAPLTWHTVKCTRLEGAENFSALVKILRKQCRPADWPAPAKQLLLRLQLTGASPLHRELRDRDNIDTLIEELQAALGTLDVEIDVTAVHMALDSSNLEQRNDVLGEALRLLTAAQTDEDLLRTLAPEPLASGEANLDRLKTLCDGADRELIAALLRVDS